MPTDQNERPQDEGTGGEEALIAEFWAPLAAGYAGAFDLQDDCATIVPPPGEELVVTTDALIAGVHFFPGDDPAAIGWKALAVNVSDLAAKGARPLAYVMGAALPEFDRPWLAAFTSGLKAAQDAFGCQLAGGDTDRTPGPLSVSITAFGSVPSGGLVRRGTARTGDRVYVTGTIGDAALGLALMVDPGLRVRCSLDQGHATYLERRFSRPQPPVALVSALRAYASAAMDISDGLMKDFDRLCRASNTGGIIEASSVPLSEAARRVVTAQGAKLEDLMTGGEDYEVLATVALQSVSEFERAAAAAGTRATCIGIMTDAHAGGIAVDATGEPLSFAKPGWDHFLRR